jgi:hypothetical protein
LKLFVVAVCDVSIGVLAAAGLIKFFDPRPWAAAVVALGVPVRPVLRRRVLPVVARVVGVGEVLVAGLALFVGGPIVYAALAVVYAVFAAVAAAAWRRGGASCGCFGAKSAPLSGVHVVLNASIALSAAVAALVASASLPTRLDDGVATSIVYLCFAALGSAALIALMTSGAELASVSRVVVRRTPPRPHGAHR